MAYGRAPQLLLTGRFGDSSLEDLGTALDLWENMSQGFSGLFPRARVSIVPRAAFSLQCRWRLSLGGRSWGDVRSGTVPSALCVTSGFFPPGGGITERNLQRILEGSTASEFHCSARSARDSGMKFR